MSALGRHEAAAKTEVSGTADFSSLGR